MFSTTNDNKTVAYDWKLHLEQCAECKVKPNAAHQARCRELSIKYPVKCHDCGKYVEDHCFKCYNTVKCKDGSEKRCGSTRLYFYAHQPDPWGEQA